jgi:hypothetical protein
MGGAMDLVSGARRENTRVLVAERKARPPVVEPA